MVGNADDEAQRLSDNDLITRPPPHRDLIKPTINTPRSPFALLSSAFISAAFESLKTKTHSSAEPTNNESIIAFRSYRYCHSYRL